MVRLGVNIDHIATVRQARGENFPDPLSAAQAAVAAGADGITAHLREDRRHIQDRDLQMFKSSLSVPLNMEMSIAKDIVEVACLLRPVWVCLVPEKRKELTTEGGLDVQRESANIAPVVQRLKDQGIKVSLFVDPSEEAVRISRELGSDAVELHTGKYAKLFRTNPLESKAEVERIRLAAQKAGDLKMLANAGHGIDYENVGGLLQAHPFYELNIGFSIIARALFVGITQAVKEMKTKMKAE